MSKSGVKWIMELDPSFYDMWCVRPLKDKDFNSPRSFHFVFKEDAESFLKLIERSHHAVPNK